MADMLSCFQIGSTKQKFKATYAVVQETFDGLQKAVDESRQAVMSQVQINFVALFLERRMK
jgi:hypothetical protein